MNISSRLIEIFEDENLVDKIKRRLPMGIFGLVVLNLSRSRRHALHAR